MRSPILDIITNKDILKIDQEDCLFLEKKSIESLGLGLNITQILKSNGCKNAIDTIVFLKLHDFEIKHLKHSEIIKAKRKIKNILNLLTSGKRDIVADEIMTNEKMIIEYDETKKIINSMDELIIQISESQNHHILSRNFNILRLRLMHEDRNLHTLEKIGENYGLTRERVRQIEKKCLRWIRDLLSGKTTKLNITLDRRYTTEFFILKHIICSETILTTEDIMSIIQNQFLIGPSENNLKIIMRILEFEEFEGVFLEKNFRVSGFWHCSQYNTQDIKDTIFEIKEAIKNTQNINIQTIIYSLKEKSTIKDEYFLKKMISLINDMIIEDDHISYPSYFVTQIDLAFSILNSYNKPMSVSDIVKRIEVKTNDENQQNIRTQTFTNKMVRDKRFKCIGKSGLWGLRSWNHVFYGSIIDAIKYVFIKNGNLKMEETEIITRIKEIRPDASEASIKTYLTQEEIFIKQKNFYELSLNEPKKIRRSHKDLNNDFYNSLQKIFTQKQEIKLSELIKLIKSDIKISDCAIRNKLNSNECFVHLHKNNSVYIYMDTNCWKNTSSFIVGDHDDPNNIY